MMNRAARAKEEQTQMGEALIRPAVAGKDRSPAPVTRLPAAPVEQPAAAGAQSRVWQDILWREWRNCVDREYAGHLFHLLGDTALGGGSMLVLGLGGTLFGLLLGYWLAWLVLNLSGIGIESLATGYISLLVWFGGIAGGVAGVLFSRWLTWRNWLALLTPTVFDKKLGGLGCFNGELLAGFGLGLVVTSGVMFLFPFFLFAVFLLRLRLISEDMRRVQLNFLSAGIGIGLGTLAGQGDPLHTAAAGLLTGGWIGLTWGSAPLGLLVGWLGVFAGLSGLGSVGMLHGALSFAAGFAAGLIPNALGQGLDAEDAYPYRSWYFWWRGQPLPGKVETALRLASKEWPETWAKPLSLLAQQSQPGSPEDLVKALQSANWPERFAARHGLVRLGGETVDLLMALVNDETALQETGLWLLTNIEQETGHRLAWRTDQILCPRCLARFGAHSTGLAWGISFTYYGCRICRQSREFLYYPRMVAVLDRAWTGTHSREEDHLRLNWFVRRNLFDFDEVEIIRATDEDAERLAIQVGNDTDPFRRPRYRQMRCVIGPECRLSDNTLRILQRIFGDVQTREERS